MQDGADDEECQTICDTTEKCTAYELSDGCHIYYKDKDLKGDGSKDSECWLKSIKNAGLPGKDTSKGNIKNEENKKKSINRH
jgi:hypothetical protein